jgi:hypothetical protein
MVPRDTREMSSVFAGVIFVVANKPDTRGINK